MNKKTLSSLFMLGAAGALFALPPHVGYTSYKASSINNFDFNLSWENVQFESNSSPEISVDIYCNNSKYAPKVKVSSDTLIIESVPLLNQFLGSKKKCTVIVKFPEGKSFDQFKVQTSSGDINSTISFAAKDIYLQASSGNIKVEENISSSKEAVIKTSSGNSFVNFISAKKLTASASSGDITINDTNSKTAAIQTSSGCININGGTVENATITASSGDITCSNFSGGDSNIQTTSGNIKLKKFDASDFHSSASSGNITARDLTCKSFNVSTSSGTIGLELVDAPVSKSSVTSSSGTQFISMPTGSRISLQVTTSSGSFTNAFTKEKLNSHVNYNQAINGGGAKVSFTSSSGTITLDIGDGISALRRSVEDSETDELPVIIFGDEK